VGGCSKGGEGKKNGEGQTAFQGGGEVPLSDEVNEKRERVAATGRKFP